MKKYQFIVFMQDSDYDDIEQQIKEKFNFLDFYSAFQYKENYDYAIEFLNEIGTAADIYYSDNNDYVLITYGFYSAIGLYRVIEE